MLMAQERPECGEALLSLWRRSQIHTAGVRVGGPSQFGSWDGYYRQLLLCYHVAWKMRVQPGLPLSAYWPCIAAAERREPAPEFRCYDAHSEVGACNVHMRFVVIKYHWDKHVLLAVR
jgi:hypothetical protein